MFDLLVLIKCGMYFSSIFFILFRLQYIYSGVCVCVF